MVHVHVEEREMQRTSVSRLYFLVVLLVALVSVTPSLPARDSQPPIHITVDLREAPRRIFHARLEIPAAPGPLTLLYPKWIPGEHGPTGPIDDVACIKFSAARKPLA